MRGGEGAGMAMATHVVSKRLFLYLSPYKVNVHAGEAVVQENDETGLFSNMESRGYVST
jgi:hypothetical protein